MYHAVESSSKKVYNFMNITISDKHFVSNLVVMVYLETALSFIVLGHISLLPQSDGLPIGKILDAWSTCSKMSLVYGFLIVAGVGLILKSLSSGKKSLLNSFPLSNMTFLRHG